jgi:hypothetical protein
MASARTKKIVSFRLFPATFFFKTPTSLVGKFETKQENPAGKESVKSALIH